MKSYRGGFLPSLLVDQQTPIAAAHSRASLARLAFSFHSAHRSDTTANDPGCDTWTDPNFPNSIGFIFPQMARDYARTRVPYTSPVTLILFPSLASAKSQFRKHLVSVNVSSLPSP